MHEIARPFRRHATTQAAEGLQRIRWTFADFERLSELGFFGGIDGERERVELIDGEIIPERAGQSRIRIGRDGRGDRDAAATPAGGAFPLAREPRH